jgi:hypothetical protein
LNNININSWATDKIVHIIKEHNTEIALALDSRKSGIQLLMFLKLHATVVTAGWSVIPCDLCTVPAKISSKIKWHRMNIIPFEIFSMGVFVNVMVSPFLN